MELSECYFTSGNKISVFINGGNFLADWATITGKKKNLPLSGIFRYDVDIQKLG